MAPAASHRRPSDAPLSLHRNDSYGVQESDPDEVARTLDDRRQRALREVDEAPYGPFHRRLVVVAGLGFLAEAYDIFAISIASVMLGMLYGDVERGTDAQRLSPGNLDLKLKLATSLGTLVGHLIFGWTADIWGRKRMYGYELVIITVATFTQALAGSAPGLSIIGVLTFWRVIVGLGVGGDYPLSAVITSEFASTHIRGRLMTAVFACQGWGNLLASIVGLIVVSAYQTQLKNNPNSTDAIEPMWRLLIGLGCIPGVAAMYFRLTIPETPRFTMDIERNVQQASSDIKSFLANGTYYADPDAVMLGRSSAPAGPRKDFFRYFSKWKNAKVLLGTSWSWLAADVAFYGLGLNSSAFGPYELRYSSATDSSRITHLQKVCQGSLILATGLVPGYWASFFFIDRIGRKPIQFMGFAVLTVIFFIMGFGFDKLTHGQKSGTEDHPAHPGLIFMFCLANFFLNFGPNVTTFVVPGELFPTRYRSTSFGISAACGKLGAIIAQVMFAELSARMENKGDQLDTVAKIFFPVCAGFMLTGILATLLLPETKGATLEDLSSDNDDLSSGMKMTTLRQVDSAPERYRSPTQLSYGSPQTFGSARR